MDFSKITLSSAIDFLNKKEISPLELMTETLKNIEKHNSTFNVFLTTVSPDDLLESAKKVVFDPKLPLSGLPLALKDLFSTKDIRTTAASNVLKNYIPVYDSTVTKKIKNSGAIIVGKLNQDAWAHGSTGENSDFGATGNAYDSSRVAGGSSSGSATAVALNMALATTGSDTGGSIRAPAAFSNLVGLKPTYGRVSRYGIIAMASSLDSIGHVTKTVEDSALLLSVTAGEDPYDSTTSPVKVPDYCSLLNLKDLKGVKIGVVKEFNKGTLENGISAPVNTVVNKALETLKKLGATIKEISLPHAPLALEAYYILCPSEVSSNLARYDGIRYGLSRENFGDEAKRRMMIGTYSLSSGYYDAYYNTALKIRTLVIEDFENAFKDVDLIFAPTTPIVAPKIGEKVNDPMALYLIDIFTVPVNLAGVPALSLPAGFADGMPVGIQLIGPQFSEEKLFQIGKVFEDETEFYKVLPKLV